MKFEDLAGLGKPLVKLIETIARGAGNVYQPHLIKKLADSEAYRTRQLADATAYEIKTLAQATSDATKTLGSNISVEDGKIFMISDSTVQQNIPQLSERADSRTSYQEALQQDNLENITSIAAEQLALLEDEEVSDEPVDQDWINRFFEDAKFISNEEMQMLWGRILAGEVKKPSSFSLRALNILKNMTREDARLIEKTANLAIGYFTATFLLRDLDWLRNEVHIMFEDIIHLSEIGIVTFQNDLVIALNMIPDVVSRHDFTYCDSYIVALYVNQKNKVEIPIIRYTMAGRELLQLVKTELNTDYISKFASCISSHDSLIGYQDAEMVNLNQHELDNFGILSATGKYSKEK